jgi:DNA-directed RNA polymerase specialized sigma24 family protein
MHPTSEVLRKAFRDLHSTRLYGFALLATLGDRRRAASLTGDALAAGTARTEELRHPERAAAWLRRQVMREAVRGRSADAPSAAGVDLQEIGVNAPILAGLSALTTRERGALVAASVERFDRRDVATIVDVDGARLDRLIGRARGRFAVAVADALDEDSMREGPWVARIRDIAARALR